MIGDFLKPPTDNLYKFMTISGLILLLISLTYPPWLLNKAIHSYYENQRDSELLRVDSEESHNKLELLKRQQEVLSKQVQELSGQTNPDEKTKSKLEEKDQEIMKQAVLGMETSTALMKNDIELQYRIKAAQWELQSGRTISILALLGAIVGAWLMRKGFNLWSLRVQVFQDAIRKKEAQEVTSEKTSDLPRS